MGFDLRVKIHGFSHNTNEHGAGAAPIEMTNFTGIPLCDGLIFANNVLIDFELMSLVPYRMIKQGQISEVTICCK